MAGSSKVILAGVAVVCVALAVATWIGSRRRWNTLSAMVDRLVHSATAPDAAAEASRRALDAVPAPVARYLRWALPSNTRIQQVRMRQIGTLRTDIRSERWMPFEAEHIVVPHAAGFVWNARVKVAPWLHVRVRDALIEGRGSGHVSLVSAFTLADADTPEMNSGSLHRYLAEAVWYPTALMPGPNLQWTAIDASRALATLSVDGVSVSLEFRFADTGEVAGIYTSARWGKFGEGYKQVPWEGHFRDYQNRNGVLVPTHGDVGWYAGSGRQAVWRANITAFQLWTEH